MTSCLDCGGPWELYVVHDALWRSAGYAPDQVACQACLERRIGRALTVGDLTDAPASDALRLRLGGTLSRDRAALYEIARALEIASDADADADALARIEEILHAAGIREIPGEDAL